MIKHFRLIGCMKSLNNGNLAHHATVFTPRSYIPSGYPIAYG
jgi:hypothetical protein